MGIAATLSYFEGLLNGVTWPAGMTALTSPPPPLACYIQPPDPNIMGGTPTAYIWYELWEESRGNGKLRAATIPRAAYPGAPSGTKSTVYMVPVYVVWMGGAASDPNLAMLFPGMLDTIQAALRSSTNPATATDPWTGAQSSLVDVGEVMTGHGYLRDLEPQMSPPRLDALITLTVTEVITA